MNPKDRSKRQTKNVELLLLEESLFSPGDVYLVNRDGKRIKFLSSGDCVDKEMLSRFFNRNLKIESESMINESFVKELVDLFKGLERISLENDRLIYREKILFAFKQVFWDGKESASLLDLMTIGARSFYSFSFEQEEILKGISVTLFKRSGLFASLAVFMAMIMGHLDFIFLKDLYHVCFLMNYSFKGNGLSFHVNHAMEEERKESGSGLSYLKEQATKVELESFQNLSLDGYKKAKIDFSAVFNNPDILILIQRCKEHVSGSGMPLGLAGPGMIDIENIVVFLDKLIPCNDLILNHDDGKKYLYRAKENSNIATIRIMNMMATVLNSIRPKEEEVVDNMALDEVIGI